jgi:hypothetical protein
MKHTPLSDDEIAKSGLMQAGIYDFEVADAEEKTSAKGNDMLEIKLNVYEHDGSIRPMRDWILPQMAKKFKHFHNATGMMDKYESGNLSPSDVIGKKGKLMIKTEPYINKDGIKVESNKIEDYVKRENMAGQQAVDLSDEIPF